MFETMNVIEGTESFREWPRVSPSIRIIENLDTILNGSHRKNTNRSSPVSPVGKALPSSINAIFLEEIPGKRGHLFPVLPRQDLGDDILFSRNP